MAQLKSTVIQGTLSVTDEISENGATLASKYLGITGKAVSASTADAASSVPWTGVTNRPGNATTSAAGLMSAADKVKLDAALTGITANQVTGALGFNPATRDAATTSATGLMSAADKAKLDGIASGANKYVLPAATTSALGGIIVGSNLTITSTGKLSAVNTTYGVATTTAAGLMSAADKTALNNAETKSNKTTTITESSTDTQYPSAKSVYTYVQDNKFDVSELEEISGAITVDASNLATTDDLASAVSSASSALSSEVSRASTAEANIASYANTKLVYYGTCATAKATQAKTATLVNGDNFTLTPGVCVAIKFTYASAAAPMTLSVNGTTACTIMQYGTTQASSGTTTSGWAAGAVVLFIYDGTYWYRTFWSNTTYSSMSQTEADTGTATSARSISASVLATTINNRIAGKEDSSNKVTSLSSESTDIEYPSAKSVYDALQAVNISAQTTGSGNVISSISAATGVITAVKGITALTAETPLTTAASGSGNVVTDITVSGHQITKVKGITALTSLATGSSGSGNVVTDITVSGNTITKVKGITALTAHSPVATTTVAGLVSTGAQSFAGKKTFTNDIAVGNANLVYTTSGTDKILTISFS